MYTLYSYHPSGNCYKIRLLMSQLGIAYNLIDINILNKESRTDEFLQKNLNGRIPVLQHDEKYLPESNAALWYLADGSKLIPEDKFEQAQVLQWMFFEQYSHEPNIATVRFWITLQGTEEENADVIPQKRGAGYAALDVMEEHLSTQPFFVGSQYSIADIALYAYTHVAPEGGFDLSTYKHINAWMERVRSQENHITIDDRL